MRRTLNVLNLSKTELVNVVSKELQVVKGGTVIVRNINSATEAERVARLAMKHGWAVGCKKRDKSFILIISKGVFNKSPVYAYRKSASEFAN